MRKARIKDDGECWYHIVSRTAFQEFKFTDEAKDMFVAMLRRVAYFSGIDVLNHCVMSNHFHVLVHVRRTGEITEEELLRRVAALYGADNAEELRTRWEDMRKRKMLKRIEEEQEAFTRRMGDISPFMKCLKQRYSVWFRHNCGMFAGTLWEGRFKSVLIEGGEYLRAVVNYIHMNPVRAKIVPHASQYAWSALGAAALGDAFALKGLSLVGVGLEGLSPQEAGVRDRRLSNGVILGSLAFVRRFGTIFSFGMGRRGRRIVSFSRHGTNLYATHGQHSAPKVA
jgi:REP element-mobilizing transposase RayT